MYGGANYILPFYRKRYYFIQKYHVTIRFHGKTLIYIYFFSGMMKAKKKEAEVEKRITLSIAPRGKKKAVTVVQV